jgi:hypothetical protein
MELVVGEASWAVAIQAGGLIGGFEARELILVMFRRWRFFDGGGMRRYQFRVSTQILSFSHPTLNFCTAGQRLVYSANDCDDTVKQAPEGIYRVFSIEKRQKPQSWSENSSTTSRSSSERQTSSHTNLTMAIATRPSCGGT